MSDSRDDVSWMADKLVGLRIFEDDAGKMNCSVLEAGGEVLLVSQFTLYGDCRKGKRPSFSTAANPEKGKEIFELLAAEMERRGVVIRTGIFQADMDVELVNDGPVTILLDSEKKF